jgi:hypothetical protein
MFSMKINSVLFVYVLGDYIKSCYFIVLFDFVMLHYVSNVMLGTAPNAHEEKFRRCDT